MRLSRWSRELRNDPIASSALFVAVLLFVLAVLVPMIHSVDVVRPNLPLRLEAPTWAGGSGGFLGTDELGRDLWMRILHGLRTSFVVSVSATLLAAFIGTTIGVLAGYYGGWVDLILMRITDVQLSFPGLLLVMVIVGVLGRGSLVLILALGMLSWMVYARVIRGAVLQLRSTEMILAITGLGASTTRTILSHVVPNILPPLVAIGALEFARIMLAEAGLSFLGFGVQPPQISLGAILASGRAFLQNQWWISTWSGLFLAAAVLSTNLVGSWLQRVTDPTRVAVE